MKCITIKLPTCPECGSDRVKVYAHKGRLRYYACDRAHRFKAIIVSEMATAIPSKAMTLSV